MKTQRSLEAERLNGYLVLLFLLLSTATLFDGFDAGLLSFAAPEVRATFDISRGEWGFVTGLTRFGVMASFLFLISFLFKALLKANVVLKKVVLNKAFS